MIDNRELRIGNWYKWSDIASMGIGYDQIKNGVDIDNYPSLRDPIPLTPEILEKAGFEGDHKNKKLYLKKYHGSSSLWIYTQLDAVFIVLDMGKDLYWMQNDGIHYLHQLQNLYFCLTGEELEINL